MKGNLQTFPRSTANPMTDKRKSTFFPQVSRLLPSSASLSSVRSFIGIWSKTSITDLAFELAQFIISLSDSWSSCIVRLIHEGTLLRNVKQNELEPTETEFRRWWPVSRPEKPVRKQFISLFVLRFDDGDDLFTFKSKWIHWIPIWSVLI